MQLLTIKDLGHLVYQFSYYGEVIKYHSNRHFSLLNVKFAGACGYDFVWATTREGIFETKARGDMKNYLVKITNSPPEVY